MLFLGKDLANRRKLKILAPALYGGIPKQWTI